MVGRTEEGATVRPTTVPRIEIVMHVSNSMSRLRENQGLKRMLSPCEGRAKRKLQIEMSEITTIKTHCGTSLQKALSNVLISTAMCPQSTHSPFPPANIYFFRLIWAEGSLAANFWRREAQKKSALYLRASKRCVRHRIPI